jgi:acetone carboxylase gamma subunit
MTRSISPTLEIRGNSGDDKICCRDCGQELASAGRAWKPFAVVCEIPTDRISHEVTADNPAATIVRLFVCRGCGALLDTETALPGEPFLDDIVAI